MILYQGKINSIDFNTNPTLVSLVPSISHFLLDLNLQTSLIGITNYCDTMPFSAFETTRIKGTKNPDIAKIAHLKPDLILANKEENRKEDIETLSKNHTVYLSDVYDIPSMLVMMNDIGILLDKQLETTALIQNIEYEIICFQQDIKTRSKMRACYLIWKKPYMSIGKDTFINSMLELAGFENIFQAKIRYPQTSMEEIINQAPDIVLLSSEPYPFRTKHLNEFSPLPTLLVDGRMFSWYGSFMIQSFNYLKALNEDINNTV